MRKIKPINGDGYSGDEAPGWITQFILSESLFHYTNSLCAYYYREWLYKEIIWGHFQEQVHLASYAS